MQRTSENSVITITHHLDHQAKSTEYFTDIRKVNAFITLLRDAGYNENHNAHDCFQIWTKPGNGFTEVQQFTMSQFVSNFDTNFKRVI